MAHTYLNEVYSPSPLPSPPLSPMNHVNTQLPSPPLSPASLPTLLPFECTNEEMELEYEDDDEFDFTEREIEYLESFLGSPIERPNQPSNKNDVLRNKYLSMMEEGVEINGEMTPYVYAVERLHQIGSKVINKRTSDAVPLRVYETGKDTFEEFWVHPLFLTLQSFQFFKLFEEIRENGEEEEEGVIEIEVPSLKAFAFVLYFIYTGDHVQLFKIAKLDESFCKGIMENIECLEINMITY